MTPETKHGPKAGVGALIIDPETFRFLCITELHVKRGTNKLAGQISIPMESVEPTDRDRRRAWKKLFTEEIKPVNFDPREINQMFLGQFELVPNIFVHCRAFIVPHDAQIVSGTKKAEVTDMQWHNSDEILRQPQGSIRFRLGVREIIKTFYIDFQQKLADFKPVICSYGSLLNNIPVQIFELMEEGLSQSEALSQLGIDPKPLEDSLALIHSL